MPQNLHELKIRIGDACESVDVEICPVFGMRSIIVLMCVESQSKRQLEV